MTTPDGTSVLVLHGLTGLCRDHWLSHLAHDLAEDGALVEVPVFSEPDRPALDVWLDELAHHLDTTPPGARRVVLAHSLGAALWLHHAARLSEGPRVDCVLLVAPPGRDWHHPDVHGFLPAPLDAAAVRRAACWTQLVAGENDPALPLAEAVDLATELKIDLDVVPGGGPLDPTSGYGPWPAVVDWVRDRHARITANATPA